MKMVNVIAPIDRWIELLHPAWLSSEQIHSIPSFEGDTVFALKHPVALYNLLREKSASVSKHCFVTEGGYF